jgi:[acyl-carrier-protein] S-malonyltransferase
MGALPAGGAMASINGMSLPEVADLTARSARETSAIVVVGLVNGPSAIVVSGDEPAVDHACELASDHHGIRSTRLTVSHAFHSPLMRDARGPWNDIVQNEEFLPPAVPLIADLTGEIVDTPDRIRELLVEQLTCSVRWDLVSSRLAADGETEAIEAGDSTVLRGFARSYPGLQVSSMAQPQVLARFRPARERRRVPAAAAARRGEGEGVNG